MYWKSTIKKYLEMNCIVSINCYLKKIEMIFTWNNNLKWKIRQNLINKQINF